MLNLWFNLGGEKWVGPTQAGEVHTQSYLPAPAESGMTGILTCTDRRVSITSLPHGGVFFY